MTALLRPPQTRSSCLRWAKEHTSLSFSEFRLFRHRRIDRNFVKSRAKRTPEWDANARTICPSHLVVAFAVGHGLTPALGCPFALEADLVTNTRLAGIDESVRSRSLSDEARPSDNRSLRRAPQCFKLKVAYAAAVADFRPREQMRAIRRAAVVPAMLCLGNQHAQRLRNVIHANEAEDAIRTGSKRRSASSNRLPWKRSGKWQRPKTSTV